MNAPQYAPDFRVAIDGEPLPATARGSVTAVTCQTGLEGADRVEVSIANENLRWLDHPLFALDRRLELSLGYAPDPLEQVFVGEVVGHTATFPSGGIPTLTVAAQDRLHHLQQGTKVRWFGIPTSVGNVPIPDPLVADIVSLENGFVPIVEPVGAAISVLLGGIDIVAEGGDMQALQKVIRKEDGESDFDFLKRISAENGWEMLVDYAEPMGGYKLRFMSPLDHLTPDVTYTYGQSLLEFTPRISTVGQIVAVTAFVWIAAIKTSFAVTVGWDWDRNALTIDIRPGLMPMGTGPSSIRIEDPVTLASAPRTIISELIPRLNQRLTGSGSVVGDPRLRAAAVVRLDGLGAQFGGLYRVTSATHTIDGGGYRTSFEVRKEIWFGSVPPAAQGAVPVRVSAPFLS